MVTETIKKNPNKLNITKNMIYENMALYIREQDNDTEVMVEFKKQINLSEVKANSYMKAKIKQIIFNSKADEHTLLLEKIMCARQKVPYIHPSPLMKPVCRKKPHTELRCNMV